MFVGTTGVDLVVARTAELMREHDTEDIAPHGGIPLDVIQKYINFHYSVSLDLFGSERSTNAANYFTAGLKGRWQEERRKDDHVLTEDSTHIDVVRDGEITTDEVSALVALNYDLRRRAASTGACTCRTSGSTGTSGPSPSTTSRRRATWSAPTSGRPTGTAGCPARPTRPTSAR